MTVEQQEQLAATLSDPNEMQKQHELKLAQDAIIEHQQKTAAIIAKQKQDLESALPIIPSQQLQDPAQLAQQGNYPIIVPQQIKSNVSSQQQPQSAFVPPIGSVQIPTLPQQPQHQQNPMQVPVQMMDNQGIAIIQAAMQSTQPAMGSQFSLSDPSTSPLSSDQTGSSTSTSSSGSGRSSGSTGSYRRLAAKPSFHSLRGSRNMSFDL